MSSRIEVGVWSGRWMFRAGVAACLGAAPDIDVIVCGADDDDLAALGAQAVVIVDGQNDEVSWPVTGALPVVLFAGPHQQFDLPTLLRAGVRAVFADECDDAALVDAVRAASRGDLYVDRYVADLLLTEAPARRPAVERQVEDFGLTCREVEIWELLAAGGANEDIADRMDLSARTVRFHLSNLFRKLGVQKRGEAIALAYRTAGHPAGFPGEPARIDEALPPVGNVAAGR